MRETGVQGLAGTVKMREDGQGLEDQLLGVTKKVPEYPFTVIDNMMLVPARARDHAGGPEVADWVKTLKPRSC